ncbi:hypothetical protein EVG20_g3011 [Dentipellis fragilis]|uniref:Uncharacterized protein n=1 Tax=Dentipellis fragilis TaxID=205917 RepID=A0A4Y9Z4L3_9AGAM|nr:hypothetical protein EVG20_g3011 [Dentipellis fragilis]
MTFTADQMVLVAIFVESITYGICVIMSLATLMIFLRVDANGKVVHKKLLSLLVLMLVIATLHIVLSFVRVFAGFVRHRDNVVAYFSNVGHPLVIGKNSFLLIQTGLGDSINIWRCYIVYGKKWWVIIFPLVMLIGAFATGVSLLVNQNPNATVFSIAPAIGTACDALTMATNVYCTSAITWKIWTTAEFTTRVSNLMPILIFVLQTGALYTSALVVWLGTNLANSLSQFIITDMLNPLIPSMFCLLVLQVKFHQFSCNALDDMTDMAFGDPQQTSHTKRWSGMRRRRESHTGLSTVSTRPVATDISTHVDECSSGEDAIRMQKSPAALTDIAELA